LIKPKSEDFFMDGQNDTVVEGSGPTGGPGVVTQSPPTQSPAPQDDYRAKYSGVVSRFDTLRTQLGYTKWEDVPPATQVQAWQQAQGQLTEFQGRVTNLTGELELTKGQVADLGAWKSKVKTILEIDPSLIEFVDDIATVSDAEQQKSLITAFSQKLAKRVGVQPQGNPRTPVPVIPPSSPPVQPGDTTDDVTLYSQMVEALQASRTDPSKRAEYEKYRDQWYARQA
jgi:hypothetical protein